MLIPAASATLLVVNFSNDTSSKTRVDASKMLSNINFDLICLGFFLKYSVFIMRVIIASKYSYYIQLFNNEIKVPMNTEEKLVRPLEGVVVVDSTHVLAGPYCT